MLQRNLRRHDFIQCFSFKGVMVVSKDSPRVRVASAAGRVHVALQWACEWAKENSWLASWGPYNAHTLLCIQMGEWDLTCNSRQETWTKSCSEYCGRKRIKATNHWPCGIDTNCAIFVGAWNPQATTGFDWVEIYPLWNSTMVAWIRKCH